MKHNDISFTANSKEYCIMEIYSHNKDYYAGYITAMLTTDTSEHEVLFCIHDKHNSSTDNVLISIDYGWELPDSVCKTVENELIMLAESLNINIAKLEIAQAEYINKQH